jgi:hypothetical protein
VDSQGEEKGGCIGRKVIGRKMIGRDVIGGKVRN